MLPYCQWHPASKVHRVNKGPIWGRQDPCGPHVDPMNLAIWGVHVFMDYIWHEQCKKLGKIFTGPTYQLLLSFAVILDVYRSFTINKTTFTKYCLTQWISTFPGSFEICWVSQYLAGIVNTAVYKTEPIFSGLRHCKWVYFLILLKSFTKIQPFYTQPNILPLKHSRRSHESSAVTLWGQSSSELTIRMATKVALASRLWRHMADWWYCGHHGQYITVSITDVLVIIECLIHRMHVQTQNVVGQIAALMHIRHMYHKCRHCDYISVTGCIFHIIPRHW